jgi:hypothetical protein
VEQAATAEVESAEAKAARAQTEELAKLRADKEARDRADAEAAAKRKADEEAKAKAAAEAAERAQIEADTRKKIEAEMAAKQKAEEEARLKAKAEEEAKRKAEEADRRAAEAGELALRLSVPDRQHIQVALTALGFNTNGTDGALGGHSRDMIAAWQKGHNYPGTGYLTGPQNQALLREAGPALSRFDEEQKKTEEARKKADEEKAKAEAAAKAAAPAPAAQPTTVPAPNVAAAAPKGPNGDGMWRGSYRCSPSRGGPDFNMNIQIAVTGGTGTWVRPGSGPGSVGNQSLSITIRGNTVAIARNYVPEKASGQINTAQMSARYDGANTISGGGAEQYSGGRSCEINLTRQ